MLQRLILLTHYFPENEAPYHGIIQEHNSHVKQGVTVPQHLCIHTPLIQHCIYVWSMSTFSLKLISK